MEKFTAEIKKGIRKISYLHYKESHPHLYTIDKIAQRLANTAEFFAPQGVRITNAAVVRELKKIEAEIAFKQLTTIIKKGEASYD